MRVGLRQEPLGTRFMHHLSGGSLRGHPQEVGTFWTGPGFPRT